MENRLTYWWNTIICLSHFYIPLSALFFGRSWMQNTGTRWPFPGQKWQLSLTLCRERLANVWLLRCPNIIVTPCDWLQDVYSRWYASCCNWHWFLEVHFPKASCNALTGPCKGRPLCNVLASSALKQFVPHGFLRYKMYGVLPECKGCWSVVAYCLLLQWWECWSMKYPILPVYSTVDYNSPVPCLNLLRWLPH